MFSSPGHTRTLATSSSVSIICSLKRNPTDARVWVAIAKAYRDSGKSGHAEYAVRKAVYMNRNNPALIWESGVFFLLEDAQSFVWIALPEMISSG